MADIPENYEFVDFGKPDGYTSPADREELKTLLGLTDVHDQGVSIPAGFDYRKEYIERSEGRQPTKIGKPYWD